MTFDKGFGEYVCEGDSIEAHGAGFTFTARLERDIDTTPMDFDGPGWCFNSAYPANQEIIAAWKRDEWNYFTVVITASVGDVELGRMASLSGLEGNFPGEGNTNTHLTDTAHSLLPEALHAARARRVEMIAKLAAVE